MFVQLVLAIVKFCVHSSTPSLTWLVTSGIAEDCSVHLCQVFQVQFKDEVVSFTLLEIDQSSCVFVRACERDSTVGSMKWNRDNSERIKNERGERWWTLSFVVSTWNPYDISLKASVDSLLSSLLIKKTLMKTVLDRERLCGLGSQMHHLWIR